jgi:UDP-glucuronate 4-epimerase
MERDFTYIDDIVNGVTKIIEKNIDSREHYKIYNIGNNQTESLQDFIKTIEQAMGKEAIKEMYPMQQGDVPKTFADIRNLIDDYGYSPNTDIKFGIQKFINWYKIKKN